MIRVSLGIIHISVYIINFMSYSMLTLSVFEIIPGSCISNTHRYLQRIIFDSLIRLQIALIATVI